MDHPELPRLMSLDELCNYLGISPDTAGRWAREGYGPPAIKVGQRTVYPMTGVIRFIDDQMNGSKASTPAQLTAALTAGSAERKAATAQRNKQLTDLDREDRESIGGVTPLVVSGVGETPGSSFQKFNSVPAQQFTAPAPPHIIQGR